MFDKTLGDLEFQNTPYSSEKQSRKDEPKDESTQSNNIMSMPIILEEYGIHFEHDDRAKDTSTIRVMYEQFSNQNLKLIEATMKNNESKKFMVMDIDNRRLTVNIAKIDQDGNCLFAAAIHQLEVAKIMSKLHIE